MGPDSAARRALSRHRDSKGAAVAGVAAEIARDGRGSFALRFLLRGDAVALRLPERAAPRFADELWRTTCFEAFIKPVGDPGYYEFNFSPSGEFAAYRFAGYRSGMAPRPHLADPAISIETVAGGLDGAIAPQLAWSGEEASARAWRVGLAAIVEEASGDKSYWALAHPAGAPDFHHPDCLALRLAPERAP